MMGVAHGASNTLGRYRLVAELGRGGMADVFLALVRGPADFNKLLVVKRLRPHLGEEQEFLQMFLDEARLAARLSHPNIVQTLEVGEADGQYYISMEYLEGQPLNRILRRCRDVATLPTLLRVMCGALVGLHAAHELTDFDGTHLRVVHRDATPHNIFVTYNGQVKVVDFGIAKAAISVAETRTGVLKGKVAYMAPEQAKSGEVDRRVDIYSVGCCLWELLTGERMWKGRSDVEVLNHVLGATTAPRLREVRPDVDPELEGICTRALSFEPDARHQTALELKGAIESYLDRIGDRSTVAELSQHIAERFADERARLRALVDEQMRLVTGMPTGKYAQLELPRVMSSGSSSPPEESGPTQPSPYGRHSVSPISQVVPRHDAALSAGPGSYPGFDRASGDPLGATQKRTVGVVAAVAATGALAVLAAYLLVGGANSSAPSAPASASAVEPESAAPVGDETQGDDATDGTEASASPTSTDSVAPPPTTKALAPPRTARRAPPKTASALPEPKSEDGDPRPGDDLKTATPKSKREIDSENPY
jgi:serine/threonine-protein kinase